MHGPFIVAYMTNTALRTLTAQLTTGLAFASEAGESTLASALGEALNAAGDALWASEGTAGASSQLTDPTNTL